MKRRGQLLTAATMVNDLRAQVADLTRQLAEAGAKTPEPSVPALDTLLATVQQDPRRYRLVDLETQTTWAFTVQDGKLVPVREVCPK